MFLNCISRYGLWNERKSKIEQDLKDKNKEQKKLVQQNKTHAHLIDRMETYKKKEDQLKKRAEKINTLIKKKTNPQALLLRLAQNTPKDLWLNALKIDQSKNITIKGMSSSYKSIGDFLSMANASLFFGKTLKIINTTTLNDSAGNGEKRLESFEIRGMVQGFGGEKLNE